MVETHPEHLNNVVHTSNNRISKQLVKGKDEVVGV
jgi:hypothetical protein